MFDFVIEAYRYTSSIRKRLRLSDSEKHIVKSKPKELFATPLIDEDAELHLSLRDLGAKAFPLINGIVKALQLGKDAVASLNPDEVLVAKVSREIQDGLNAGIYKWNIRKTDGSIMAQVMRQTDSGGWVTKTFADLERQQIPDFEMQQHLLQDMTSLAMQQQLQTIATQLEDIHKSVRRVERGQTDDRFGLITGGVNTLRLAIAAEDMQLMRNALDSLNNGAGIIQKTIETKAKNFDPIPSGAIGRTIKMLTHTSRVNYTDQHEFDYRLLREYIGFYEMSQKAIALASYISGGDAAMRTALEIRHEFLRGLDFSKVETIKWLLPRLSTEDDWLNHKDVYIKREEERFLSVIDSDDKTLSIELTGQQLIEGIENGEQRERQNREQK